jgi:hypothetical protein
VKQSRFMSGVETASNILVGYTIAVATQIIVFPLWGLHATLSQNFGIGATFTAISVVRLYLIRRLFNRLG